MDEKSAPHLEELTRALGNLDAAKLRAEFEKLLAFRVPPEVAKQSLLRKFGGGLQSQKKKLKVKDLAPNLKNFEIVGRILELSEKTLRPVEKASKKSSSTLYTGVLADETGAVPFSSWQKLPVQVGAVLDIKPAYTRVWKNRVRLSIKEHSFLSGLPDEVLPSFEELAKSTPKKLKEISALDLLVSGKAAVLKLFRREVFARGQKTFVLSGVLADETARLPFTSWIELPGVDIGCTIRFEAASVRMFRGVPSLEFLGKVRVSLLKEAELEKLAFSFEAVNKEPAPLKMREFETRGGLFDVVTSGNVLSVRPGSGVISRCPKCGRVVQKGNCRLHGKVQGVQDMRIKAILDDGTGTVSVMFNRELSEQIYGKSLEEAEALMYSDISKDAVFEDLRRILTGRVLLIRGNASKTEYGVSFVAEKVWVPEADLAVRAVELLRRLDSLEAAKASRNSLNSKKSEKEAGVKEFA
ncbi:MAG: Single-stranded DNA binding protein [Methanosarcinaceae archaeon]|nr:Single-stranded DNA binding protein [Methanosarcinaceae archaeon]MDD4749301.1 Single-stranded DNA binding protein [Methanosarcinaceae archaeon]